MSSSVGRRSARVLRGGLVGLVATVPMSLLMITAERAGVMPDQPPRRIVGRLLPSLPDRQAAVVTVVSHGLYGAAAAAALAQLPVPRGLAPAIGTAYGLALWVVGYEGWVPALGVLPPGHRDDRGRVATMVAAHLVFGAIVGAFARR